MRIPGAKTAKNFSRWVQARVLGGALILGYHRISAPQHDVYEVCISPENFAEHMAVLSKYTRPASLPRLVEHLKNGSIPERSVAVTFDDGYADNLYQAKPLLEKYEIPATVFVCTGNMGGEFWWDELDRLVVSSNVDLNTLDLQMRNSFLQWNSLTGVHDAGHLVEKPARVSFRHRLYHFLLTLDVEDQNQAMQIVRNWSGLTADDQLTHHIMNQAELMQLTRDGLIELGSHTRNHPMLPRLPLKRQKEEIISGKRDLEALLNKPVDGFSYPNGRATGDAKQIVQEAGFTYACTSLHDVVRPRSDIYELTRFWQKDVNGDKFMQVLNLWMKLG